MQETLLNLVFQKIHNPSPESVMYLYLLLPLSQASQLIKIFHCEELIFFLSVHMALQRQQQI